MKTAALLAAAALGLALPTAGRADAVYHSSHVELVPVSGAPLRVGFVENIHPNGPNVFAHEVYVLVGATPDTAYQVVLLLYPFDPVCARAAAEIPTAALTTNPAGNGRADFFLAPSDLPVVLRNATHGVAWKVTSGASVAYHSACSSVTLD